ncbi:MAG: carboxypeptidase-like regulatory domain-containing protein [Bacteroidia bacterium]
MERIGTIAFIFFYHFCFSQNILTGIIKDAETKQPVPFASVGISGTNYGTLAAHNGQFKLSLRNNSDSIHISSIGYNNLVIAASQLKGNADQVFLLRPEAYELSEVKVNAGDKEYKTLGTSKYSKNICTAFSGENSNWLGEQAAIQVNYKEGYTVYLESFAFYIIKNVYEDSLQFRIMLYEVNMYGYPGKTFLKKPILFKTNVKQGEVRVDLRDFEISTDNDFFISLECLEEKMEASKFCFAGSIKVPSFVKTSPFAHWIRVKGGGGDFNVKVYYSKKN